MTGFVAATGESYLCPDTANDPHYIAGAAGARSSMTVPLKFHDEVIGTLNVESPRVNGFGPDDLQFTELFSKEIAASLHTLDLLSADPEMQKDLKRLINVCCSPGAPVTIQARAKITA